MKNNNIQQISKLLDNKLAPIQKTLSEHGKILESHGSALESIGKTLKSHGKMLNSLKKDQSVMLEMLDGEQMKQSKRLKRVEDHLGITFTTS